MQTATITPTAPATDPAALWAAARASYALALDAARAQPGEASADALEDAADLLNRLAATILATPAATPAAVALKAEALAWEIEGEADGATLDTFRLDAIRGLLGDMQALAA